MTPPPPLRELVALLAAEGVRTEISDLLRIASLLALDDPWPEDRFRTVLIGLVATRPQDVASVDRALQAWHRDSAWRAARAPVPAAVPPEPPDPVIWDPGPEPEPEPEPAPETPSLPGSTPLRTTGGPSRYWLVAGEGDGAGLLPRELERDLWRGAGAWRSDEPARTLDVAATVDHTVRAGGFPTLMWERARQERGVELWVDLDARSILGRLLAHELEAALAGSEVDVRVRRYWRVPDRLRDPDGREVLPTEIVHGSAANQVLLISDGAALVEGALGADPAALDALGLLGRTPRTALVHTGPPSARAEVQRVLWERGLAVAGPEDVAELLWTGGVTTRWTEAPDPGPLWLWAACCAVLPMTVPEADALALRRDLDLPVRAVGLPALRAASIEAEGIRFSTRDRATLLQRAATAWPDRPGLLDEAATWWRARLVSRDPAWRRDDSGRGQHRRALVALLDLRSHDTASAAAAELLSLRATPGFDDVLPDLTHLVPGASAVSDLPEPARLQLEDAGLPSDGAKTSPLLELQSRREGTTLWLTWRLQAPDQALDQRYPPVRVDDPDDDLGARWRKAVASGDPGGGSSLAQALLPDALRADLALAAGPLLVLRTDLLEVPWEALVLEGPEPITLGELGLVRQIPGTRGAPELSVRPTAIGIHPAGQTPEGVIGKLVALGATPWDGAAEMDDFDWFHLHSGTPHSGATGRPRWTGRRGLVVLDMADQGGWARVLVGANAGAVVLPLGRPRDTNGFLMLLYRQLLQGVPLGRAVASARLAVGDSAWTVYGDPGARLGFEVPRPPLAELWEPGAHWALTVGATAPAVGGWLVEQGGVGRQRLFHLGDRPFAAQVIAWLDAFVEAGRQRKPAGRLTLFAAGDGGEDPEHGTVLSTAEAAFGLELGLALQAWGETLRTSGVVDEVVLFLDIARAETVEVARVPEVGSPVGRAFFLWSSQRGAPPQTGTAFAEALVDGLSGAAADEQGQITGESLSEYLGRGRGLPSEGRVLGARGAFVLRGAPARQNRPPRLVLLSSRYHRAEARRLAAWFDLAGAPTAVVHDLRSWEQVIAQVQGALLVVLDTDALTAEVWPDRVLDSWAGGIQVVATEERPVMRTQGWQGRLPPARYAFDPRGWGEVVHDLLREVGAGSDDGGPPPELGRSRWNPQLRAEVLGWLGQVATQLGPHGAGRAVGVPEDVLGAFEGAPDPWIHHALLVHGTEGLRPQDAVGALALALMPYPEGLRLVELAAELAGVKGPPTLVEVQGEDAVVVRWGKRDTVRGGFTRSGGWPQRAADLGDLGGDPIVLATDGDGDRVPWEVALPQVPVIRRRSARPSFPCAADGLLVRVPGLDWPSPPLDALFRRPVRTLGWGNRRARGPEVAVLEWQVDARDTAPLEQLLGPNRRLAGVFVIRWIEPDPEKPSTPLPDLLAAAHRASAACCVLVLQLDTTPRRSPFLDGLYEAIAQGAPLAEAVARGAREDPLRPPERLHFVWGDPFFRLPDNPRTMDLSRSAES